MDVVHGTNHSEQPSCVFHNNDCVCVHVCFCFVTSSGATLFLKTWNSHCGMRGYFLYPILRVCGLQCFIHMLKAVAVMFCSLLHGIKQFILRLFQSQDSICGCSQVCFVVTSFIAHMSRAWTISEPHHLPKRKACLYRCAKVTHCTGCISANAGPHQLCWGGWEMGTAISCMHPAWNSVSCRCFSKDSLIHTYKRPV